MMYTNELFRDLRSLTEGSAQQDDKEGKNVVEALEIEKHIDTAETNSSVSIQ